ncbi:DUF6445 family protein [Novosphingobium sp. SG720]|uniref:DUF6445 family protein n=1 Tax=Novosphingobium sp. SG720 TaxID=2586998 RepID=UPI001445B2C4|nr:DUF6445 family protein [Novosphingobium sp. SG720]NKJ44759.1 hypothetical protein [Novosphingobium sp. SG720]
MDVHPSQSMGQEGVPLWLVDQAHPAPQSLEATAAGADFAASEGDFYPGRRAPAPRAWCDWLGQTLAALPGLSGARVLRGDFAVADRDPRRLAPVQRIPHFDDSDPQIYAAIHYLCNAPHGGTSFHRHRATGFERITPARAPLWRQALATDAARHGMPEATYHDADTATFTRIGTAELRYNRLVVYPANCLHCGDIGPSWQSGTRLTITALLHIP